MKTTHFEPERLPVTARGGGPIVTFGRRTKPVVPKAGAEEGALVELCFPCAKRAGLIVTFGRRTEPLVSKRGPLRKGPHLLKNITFRARAASKRPAGANAHRDFRKAH